MCTKHKMHVCFLHIRQNMFRYNKYLPIRARVRQQMSTRTYVNLLVELAIINFNGSRIVTSKTLW
jgi:anthranilate phosphoribosyltransferase